MIGRRPLLLLLAFALLIGAGAWWLVREPSAPVTELTLVPPSVLGEAPSRIHVARDASTEEEIPAQPARELPGISGTAAAESIDDFLADGLREPSAAEVGRARAHGRVVDRDGKPIPGARVLASLPDTRPSAALDARVNEGRVRTAESDADGRFQLAALFPGELRIAVRAAGFAPLDARPIGIALGASHELGEFRLEPGVVLRGTVFDPDRRPLPAARISLVSAPLLGPVRRLGELASTPLGTSGDDGHFQLATIAPGAWTLLVCHPDFPEGLFEGHDDASSPAGDDLELVLSPAAEIQGEIVEFDERATPGLTVIAAPLDSLGMGDDLDFLEKRHRNDLTPRLPEDVSGAWLIGERIAEVDRLGRFELVGLRPGAMYLLRPTRLGVPRSDPLTDRPDPWGPPVTAMAGSEGVELTYLPGARLSFDVVDGSTGAPIERLLVRLSGVLPATPLDAKGKPITFFPGGSVSLTDLRAGTIVGAENAAWGQSPNACELSVEIEGPGYDSLSIEGVTLEPGTPRHLGSVRLSSLAILEVQVIEADSRAPIAGAQVELVSERPELARGRKRSASTTENRGFARLTCLPTLGGILRVTRAGYAPVQQLVPGWVAAGSPPIVVPLHRGARIAVTVVDEGGARVPAARVSLEGGPLSGTPASTRSAAADDSGVARFDDVAAGAYLVRAERSDALGGVPRNPGDKGGAVRLIVELGQELEAQVTVPAISAVWGSVWQGLRPLAGAQLAFERGPMGFRDMGADLQAFSPVTGVRTDLEGLFPRVELAPGDYSVLIDHAGLGVWTRRNVRVELRPTEIMLDVDDTAITGRVRDSRGQPVPGASVRLYAGRFGKPREDLRPVEGQFLLPLSDTRRPISETTTDAAGHYRLSAVPPGMPLQMVFALGMRASALPRINVPEGRVTENLDGRIPDAGSLEILLSAPLAPPGLHYGVRIVGLRQPEGLGIDGRHFDEGQRARFDELSPGPWRVMVFTLSATDQIVEQREAQSVTVVAGKLTEFSVGW